MALLAGRQVLVKTRLEKSLPSPVNGSHKVVASGCVDLCAVEMEYGLCPALRIVLNSESRRTSLYLELRLETVLVLTLTFASSPHSSMSQIGSQSCRQHLALLGGMDPAWG